MYHMSYYILLQDAYVGHEAMAKRGILSIKSAQNVAAVEDKAQKSGPIRLRRAGQMTKREKRELEAEREEEQGDIFYTCHNNSFVEIK